tara:strand:+ start:3129 stop:3680 length:552 start_codon:yes stop_codon:yes gene_type:complete
MFKIKRSILSSIVILLSASAFLAIFIFDFLQPNFTLAEDMNKELGSLFGPLIYWAFFLLILSGLYFSGKFLISNDPVITMDNNEIKFHAPLKMHDLTMQWKEIESIQLGHQITVGGKFVYLVITPIDQNKAKKYNKTNIKADKFMPLGMSYNLEKRIGIPLKGLKLKPKEILVHAKKFLAENS